jgi:hypothetical protein
MHKGEIISTMNATNEEGGSYHPEHTVRTAWLKSGATINWSSYCDGRMAGDGHAVDLTEVLLAHANACRNVWK